MPENLNPVSAAADAGQGEVVAAPANAEENAAQEPVVEAQPGEAVKDTAEPKPVQPREENNAAKLARRKAEQEAERKIAEAQREAKEREDRTAALIAKELDLKTRDGREITTLEEFLIAKRDFELSNQGIDPTLIDKYINENPKVRKADEILKEMEKQKAAQSAWADFFDYFREENGRNFDPSTDKLPPEALTDGTPSIDKYVRYQLAEVKKQKAELEKRLKANETNEKNEKSAVGSVSSDGQTSTGDFITHDTFEANKHDQSWVVKNLNKIARSRAKWT